MALAYHYDEASRGEVPGQRGPRSPSWPPVAVPRKLPICRENAWVSMIHALGVRDGLVRHNLARDWPEEIERYERLYRRRGCLGKEQTKPLRERVDALAKEHGIRDRRRVRLEPEPPVIAEQLALAV
jgi:hypothetical protein